MSKKYFIYYIFKSSKTHEIQHVNTTIAIHPLQWQRETRLAYIDGTYTLANWKEITEEEFQTYDGWFC